MEDTKQTSKSSSAMATPAAILITGVIIAGAIIYSNGLTPQGTLGQANPSGNTAAVGNTDGNNLPQAPKSTENIKPVSGDDHIRGSINAQVIIVEFSDLECPFCKRLHTTLQQVVDEYDGKRVAWVYRHFPLDALHSKARKEAEATECANELGGNNAFWVYIDRLFEITPANNRLDAALLPEIAEYAGLDRVKFEACLNSGKYAAHVEADVQDAISSGGTGTPYSVVIGPGGKKAVISGAQPYQKIKQIIDTMLSN